MQTVRSKRCWILWIWHPATSRRPWTNQLRADAPWITGNTCRNSSSASPRNTPGYRDATCTGRRSTYAPSRPGVFIRRSRWRATPRFQPWRTRPARRNRCRWGNVSSPPRSGRNRSWAKPGDNFWVWERTLEVIPRSARTKRGREAVTVTRWPPCPRPADAALWTKAPWNWIWPLVTAWACAGAVPSSTTDTTSFTATSCSLNRPRGAKQQWLTRGDPSIRMDRKFTRTSWSNPSRPNPPSSHQSSACLDSFNDPSLVDLSWRYINMTNYIRSAFKSTLPF